MFCQQEYAAIASVEEKGLLREHDTTTTTTDDHDHTEPTPHRSIRPSRTALIIHTTLVLCYLLTSYHIYTSHPSSSFRPTQKYALAREALHYELTHFEDPTQAGGFASQAWLFAGRPRPELEAAWDGLLKNADIRVTPAEMQGLFPERIEESMRFTDGSGYYTQMAVHHNLHCLRGFHKFMNVNHYFPNITLEEYQLLQVHNGNLLPNLPPLPEFILKPVSFSSLPRHAAPSTNVPRRQHAFDHDVGL
jgi:hypothetical protein